MSTAPGVTGRLSIRGKMLLGFAAVIGLVALGNLYGITSVGQISDQSAFARDTAFRKVVYLTEIENLTKRMADSASTAVDVGISEPLLQARTLSDEIEQTVTRVAGAFESDRELARGFETLRARIGSHLDQGDELLRLASERQWSAFGPARKEFEEGRKGILSHVEELRARCTSDLDASLQAIGRLTRRTASSAAGVTAAALVAAFLIALTLSGGIVRPLRRLLGMMKKAQAGDLSVRAPVRSRDETGALSQGFNEMVEDLARHRSGLEELVAERTAQLELANQRLETELEIRQITEAAQAESEELQRQVLNSVRAGIVIVDADRREIREANAFALRLIGARRDEVVGRPSSDFLCPAEGDGCDSSTERGPVENLASQLRRADGTDLPIIRSVVPVSHDGRVSLIESFIGAPEARA